MRKPFSEKTVAEEGSEEEGGREEEGGGMWAEVEEEGWKRE